MIFCSCISYSVFRIWGILLVLGSSPHCRPASWAESNSLATSIQQSCRPFSLQSRLSLMYWAHHIRALYDLCPMNEVATTIRQLHRRYLLCSVRQVQRFVYAVFNLGCVTIAWLVVIAVASRLHSRASMDLGHSYSRFRRSGHVPVHEALPSSRLFLPLKWSHWLSS